MRDREFSKRKGIQPGQIKNPTRYVTGSLHSHRRPVSDEEMPLAVRRKDDPETRGLTVDNE